MSIGNTWYSVEAAEAGGIYVREASSIVGLGTESAQRTKVWTDTGLGEVWAPEIMAENGKTYIYFAAGVKQAHRMYGMYIILPFYGCLNFWILYCMIGVIDVDTNPLSLHSHQRRFSSRNLLTGAKTRPPR